MNNKYIFAVAIALVGVAGIWYLTSSPTQEVRVHTHTEETSNRTNNVTMPEITGATSTQTTQAPAATIDEELPAALQERMSAIQARRPNLKLDAATLQAKIAQTNTWAPREDVPSHLPLKPEEFTDGRQFISLDDLKIETLMPGDQLDIVMPDTKNTFAMTVDSVEKHDYNSISWHGHIVGADGQSYAVSFTRGESLTVGGFSTPDGHYVLQGHGKDGWIASSALLYKQDTSVTDAIHPEDVMNAEVHPH